MTVMDIRTFAVFPDKKFKYGGVVYIGFKNMDTEQLRKFIEQDSLDMYVKNKKVSKCFDYTNFYTVERAEKNKKIYVLTYRFYPPFLWSRKKIAKALEESFDECRIG